MVDYEARSASEKTEDMSEKSAPIKPTTMGPVTLGGKPQPDAIMNSVSEFKKSKLSESQAGQPTTDPSKPQAGSKPEDKTPRSEEKKKFNQAEAKHISFDMFLQNNGALNKKHSNKSWMTDVNLPLETDYRPRQVQKGKMTMDSMPPSINMKIQEYRHIDYVQFMNNAEISNFVNYWLNSFEERVGWLYGYFAEDPDYELGIRAIVEAIYEPPQQGTYNNVEIKDDPFQSHVDIIAGGLGLQKIGWIYTCRDHDTYMSPAHIIKAAQFQNENTVQHQLGFKVPKFITVVLKSKKENPNEILPEVFMISDVGMAMQRDGVFEKEQKLKAKMAIRQSDQEFLVPNVLLKGSPQQEVDHEFFLISINYGQPKTNKYSILKNYDFPPMNRKGGTNRSELKKYLTKYGKRGLNERYSCFQLILFLSREMDIDTALELANSVQHEAPCPEIIDELIKGM